MRAPNLLILSLASLLAACGSPPAPEVATRTDTTPPRPPEATPTPAGPACDRAIDVPALLARHASEYGSREAVRASLPVTLRGTTTVEKKSGPTETVLTERSHRMSALVAGLFSASGIDTEGPWASDLSNGRVVRQGHSVREGYSDRLLHWLLLHDYLVFDPKHDRASCAIEGEHAVVLLDYARADLGAPTLAFDPVSAALLSVTTSVLERTERVSFDAWQAKDARGVRWPKHTTSRGEVAQPTTDAYDAPVAGLACKPLGPGAPASPDCLAPPAATLGVTWPASGVVRLPLSKAHKNLELLVRVKAGGRDVWALLDSGAGITCVDAMTPLASSFTPMLSLDGAGSTTKVRFGLGSLDRIDLGGLSLTHVPVASVPIPALADFGDRRPELILGFSFFLSAAIRVDYAHDEIVLAKDASKLVPQGAIPVDVELAHNALLAHAVVEGAPALYELDTGDAGAFDMYGAWARGHGFPGARPTTTLRGKFGAGNEESVETVQRLERAEMGPLVATRVLSRMSDPPGSGALTGLMGNQAFARCASVTFDVAGRRVWFAPPCDRAVPEPKMGWRLDKDVITSLAPGGSAATSGLEVGDRVLAIDGKPAKVGDDTWMTFGLGKEGSVVKLLVERHGEKTTVPVKLTALLSDAH